MTDKNIKNIGIITGIAGPVVNIYFENTLILNYSMLLSENIKWSRRFGLLALIPILSDEYFILH